MNRTKLVALGLLGIVIPVTLAFTAYFITRSTIGSAGPLPPITGTVRPPEDDVATEESPSPGQTRPTEPEASESPTPASSPTATADDHGSTPGTNGPGSGDDHSTGTRDSGSGGNDD